MGMFGAGFGEKLGSALSGFGDILTGTDIQARELKQRQQQYDAEQTRANRPIVQSTGDGGYVVINPVTGQVIDRQAGTPKKTALQENYEYLNGINPSLGQSYLNAQANPMTLVTDPATGGARFVPKGGYPQQGGPGMPAIGSVVADPRRGGASASPTPTFRPAF